MVTSNSDIVQLTLPCKADYIPIACLVISSVARSIGFDDEDIQDMKAQIDGKWNDMIRDTCHYSFITIQCSITSMGLVIVLKYADLGHQMVFVNPTDDREITLVRNL